MTDIRLPTTVFAGIFGALKTALLEKASRLFLVVMFALIAPVATASSNKGVSFTCDGIPMLVSVELYYLPATGAGFGVFRKPDLRLVNELENCSLDELYQKLLIRPEIVLNQSMGKEYVTALTQNQNATTWDQVGDFRAVKLQDGMRVWITLFDVPEIKLIQEEA